MRLFTKIAFVAGAGLASAGMASGAWAYFTATGTTTTTAAVATVTPPTGVTATEILPGTGTVQVQWTRPAAPAGLSLTGFYVERLSGTTATPACASSPTTPLAAALSGCIDLAVPTGSYDYRVTAVYRTWTATSTPAPVTVGSII